MSDRKEESSLIPSDQSAQIVVLYVAEESTDQEITAIGEQSDITVRTATHIEDALGMLDRESIDCIVSEHDFAEGDALAFLDAVRARDEEMPFILFTDSGSEAVASEAISRGVTEYLQKEATQQSNGLLLEMIRRVVDSPARASPETTQFWEAVIQSANVWINALDTDGNVVSWNRAAEQISGYTTEEAVGDDTIWEKLYPNTEYRAHILEQVEAILAGETAVEEFETTIRTKSGTERAISWYSHPITDGSGELTGSVAIGRDVTDQKEVKRQFQTLIDNLPGIVYRCRNEPGWPMEFVGGECEQLTGYGADALESGEVSWEEDIIHPEDRERVNTEIQTALSADSSFEVTYRIQTTDGEQRWVWERGQQVGDSSSGTALLEGFITDVTEREEYEQQLRGQRNNLEFLNKVLRHDIRNDLQVVTLYAELLEAEVTGEDEQNYIERLIENAEHAADLTETARIMADVMLESVESRRAVNLRQVLESELDEVRSTSEKAVVTIDGALPSVTVMANEMIGSVFGNLLKNAIQHNDKDVPEVTLSMSERDGTVVVEVADNGPGIPDEQKQHIFGEGEKGLDSNGSGLGLHLVETLVEGYGGAVSVGDNDPEGTVFVVELPNAR